MNPLRKAKLEASKHFVAIVDNENYFNHEYAMEAFNYAKKIKKPIRLVVQTGLELPPDFLIGIEDVKIGYFDFKTQNMQACAYVIQKLIEKEK